MQANTGKTVRLNNNTLITLIHIHGNDRCMHLHLAQCTSVTDRQTDGQTDRFTITKTALCIASRGKNAHKVSSMFSKHNS